jgi:DNA-binding HxlR family transcriptional regulator
VLNRIGDKWTVLIVGTLSHGPLRYSQIAERIDGVSQKMLTQTLRSMERDGMVKRTIYPQIPPRVEYELTPMGDTLREPLKVLEDWATGNMSAILVARSAYDDGQMLA